MADTETDAEIYERLMKDRDSRRAIDVLGWELRHGDKHTRQAAERALLDHATVREIAAVKRWIKR